MDTSKVTRVEVIDENGRSYVNWHDKNTVTVDLQDNGRTIKVFINKLSNKIMTKNNTGTYNSGDRNSGNRNSGDRNSGNYNSGYYNSGYYNSGNYNSGYFNSGNFNSGYFNTNEPKMRFFNKDSDMTYSEFHDKYSLGYPNLKTCSWVYAKDMTDQEKKDNPDYNTLDGYLKTMTYKEAWAEYWNRASDEDKKFFTTLPNFDSAIFFEITGIDIEKKDDAMTQAMELLKKNGYKIIKD